MGGGDVDLMKVQAIEKNTSAAIMIDMAIHDEHVAVAFDEMNSMIGISNHDAIDDGLHGFGELDAVGFGMNSFDGDLANLGHAFVFPYSGFYGAGIAGASVIADEAKGGAGTVHHDSGGSQRACDSIRACFGQGNFKRLSDAVASLWENEESVSVLDGVIDGLGVISFSIACRTKVFDVAHEGDPSGFFF